MANQLRSTVRLDKVKSVYTGHLFSTRATQELENGFVVALGNIEAGNRDMHEMAVPKAGDKLYLVANPAIIYDNKARLGSDQERFYFIEKGEQVRLYDVAEKDVFSVSKLGIDKLPLTDAELEGKFLVAGAGTKLVVADAPAPTGFTAKFVRVDKVGGAMSINLTQEATQYVVMEVVSN
ncbi:hypothetical protein ACIQ1D_19440 [Lysinibacillus xylanilyticus]|uniref:hypothetical protein n=1 Tax=Lysinibacillus xylanilyticus TaxID=582475 RepID=UPI003829BF8B